MDKSNFAFDNIAFYDKVAPLANRSIFIIDEVTDKKKPIVQQPRKKLRWLEDEEKQTDCRDDVKHNDEVMVPIPEETDCNHEATDEVDSGKETDVPNQTPDVNPPIKTPTRKKSLSDSKLDIETLDDNEVNLRKGALARRRLSRSLVLKIDKTELPLIRQSSIPKFYIDTPEVNQTESSIILTPSTALTSPIRPNTGNFNFDLRSIVNIENERSQTKVETRENKRLAQIRQKMNPLKIKRQSSTKILPANVTTHM